MLNVVVAVSAGQAQQARVITGSPEPLLCQLELVPHWSYWLLQSSLPSLQAAPGLSLSAFTASSDLCSLRSHLLLQAPASPPHTATNAATTHLSPTTVSLCSSALLPPCQVLPLTSPSTLRALSFIFYLFFLRPPASPDEPCPASSGVTTMTGISLNTATPPPQVPIRQDSAITSH